ncbi:SWIM zinc finger family protein [Bacillus spongiae]|uniref:SWIM zinc finger family protein n=1 Tax=Bacillus spongiae TaxID=2683610 RepID=A0ABU8HJ71_9BACI
MSSKLDELLDKIIATGEEIKNEFSPDDIKHKKIVQKGLLLHRQNLISNIKSVNHTISAQVQDVTSAFVKLDLDFPLLSRCSCPEASWCRHRMAVFFTVFQRAGSVSQWVKEWKGEIADSKVPLKASDLTSLHPSLKKASDLLQKKDLIHQTPDEWYEYFLSVLAEVDKEGWMRNLLMLDMNLQALYRKMMKDAPIEREWKPLYQLYICVFLYETLYEWLDEAEQHSSSIFSFILDELYDAVYQMSVTAMPFAFDPFIQFLKERSIQWTSKEGQFIEGMDLYRILWFFLFTKKKWRDEEKKRLQSFSKLSEAEFIGLLHMLLLLEETEEFITLSRQKTTTLFRYCEHWLYYFFQHDHPEKAVLVLSSCLPYLPSYLKEIKGDYERSEFSRWFLQLIDPKYMKDHKPRMYKQLLLALIPYSYYPLSRFLFDQQDYREWVELQQWLGYEIGEIEYLGLKDLVKTHPEFGLPLYHDAVESYIRNRNRDSYKQAVKILKKLRSLYKKQKKIEDWDRYLEYILDDTKRLRAFHEECRKGKLINAKNE